MFLIKSLVLVEIANRGLCSHTALSVQNNKSTGFRHKSRSSLIIFLESIRGWLFLIF